MVFFPTPCIVNSSPADFNFALHPSGVLKDKVLKGDNDINLKKYISDFTPKLNPIRHSLDAFNFIQI